MTNAGPFDAPQELQYQHMRRHWWQAYEWETAEKDGVYSFVKLRRRDPGDEQRAGAEFDEMRRIYQAENRGHDGQGQA